MRMIALVLVGLSLVAATSPLFSEEEYQNAFVRFMTQYNKRYSSDIFFQRFNVFKANLDFIELHNSGNSTFSVAINAFADLTAQEFAATYNGARRPDNLDFLIDHSDNNNNEQEQIHHRSRRANPTTIDWRAKGAVTPVKNQGQCGSCWAFSTTGVIEGVYQICNHPLTSLSESQLVDCSTGNYACNGGWPTVAFQYVVNNGITGEADYPYKAVKSSCMAAGKPIRAKISSYKSVTRNSDAALETAVATNPVSVLIEADKSSFQFYSKGVFNDAGCGVSTDHAVILVGYAVDSTGVGYWLLKNSWGTGWGVGGYMYIARGNSNNGQGICAVNSGPTYAVC